MAKEILKKLDEGLHCSICLDTYADPKQLQCNHVYCRQCLVPLVVRDQQGQLGIICPNCRQVTHIQERGVAGLQPAFYINHLLEIKNSVQKLEDPAAAHTPEGAVGGATVNPSKTVTVQCCLKHAGEELKLYCETCDELICYKCALKGGKHRDHDYEELHQAFEKYKEEITASLEPMDKQVATIEKALAQLDTRCGEISDQRAAMGDNVHVTFRQLREVLNVRETELIGQLDRLTQGKLKGLAAQRDEIELILAKLNSHSYFIKESLRTNYEGAVLMMKTSMIEQVKELTTPLPVCVLEPNTDADMHITYPSIDMPAMCQSYGKLVELTGDTAAIQAKGKPCEEPIKSSEVTDTRASCSVERRGQSDISFQPAVKGRPVSTFGTPVLTIIGVEGPWGIAINQRGEVIVTEVGRHCVSVFSPSGEKVRSFGTRGSGHGQFQDPHGVAVDGEGNILVADSGNHRIQKFTSEGNFINTAGSEGIGLLQFFYPSDVAYSAETNKVYVVDSNSHRVQILHSWYLTFSSLLGKKGCKRDFRSPHGIACDSAGKVYVTEVDQGVFNLIKVFCGHTLWCSFGRHGKDEGKLDLPCDITVDSSNMVYISEWGNNRVSVFTSEGQFVRSFGREGGGPGEFKLPCGVAVDDRGQVYVCDSGNNRIQIFHAAP